MKHLIKIASKKHTSPIMNCILFDGNKARAGDINLFLFAEISGSWQFDNPRLVDAKLVKAALMLNSKNPIWHGTMLNGVELADSGRNPVDFPLFPDTWTAGAFEIVPTGNINESLKRISTAMAKNDIRYYLKGIMLNSDGILCASNGDRLHIERDVFITGYAGKFEVIIPRDVLDIIPKIDKIELSLGNVPGTSPAYTRITFGSLTIISKCIDSKFPDYKRVIPDITDRPIAVKFNGAQTDIANKLLAFSKSNKDKFHAMILCFQNGKIIAQDRSGTLSMPFADTDNGVELLDFGVNAGYMIDAMQSAYDGIMYFAGKKDSVLLESGNFRAVVMPMRV